MSTLYQVRDGDLTLAEDVNQIIRTLSNQFSLTDDAADNLGRLVLPRHLAASPPSSPSTGQQWFVTDQGVGGRLYLRHGNSQSVPYLPLRQYQKSSELGSVVDITSTSFTDVTGLSLSITTAGGRLRIQLLPGVTGSNTFAPVNVSANAAISNPYGSVRAVVGAQNLDAATIRLIGDAASSAWVIGIPCAVFIWDYQPAAGTYTVKLQALAQTNAQIQFPAGTFLMVEEWGD